MAPNSTSAALIMLVSTGRRMERSESFMRTWLGELQLSALGSRLAAERWQERLGMTAVHLPFTPWPSAECRVPRAALQRAAARTKYGRPRRRQGKRRVRVL